jgi:flagellar motility protein MotE (MotC chaperone)
MKKTLFAFFTTFLLAYATLQPHVALAAGHESEPVLWPMLPGESLWELAALFYPKSKAMQKHFIDATLRLNAETLAGHSADQPFEQGAEILLPDLYDLSSQAPKAPSLKPAVRKVQPVAPATSAPAPSAPVGTAAPASPAEVGNLEKRNQERRQELEQLNQRLRSLESEAAKMEETIEQNKAALPK